jgi:hypothetical protein
VSVQSRRRRCDQYCPYQGAANGAVIRVDPAVPYSCSLDPLYEYGFGYTEFRRRRAPQHDSRHRIERNLESQDGGRISAGQKSLCPTRVPPATSRSRRSGSALVQAAPDSRPNLPRESVTTPSSSPRASSPEHRPGPQMCRSSEPV